MQAEPLPASLPGIQLAKNKAKLAWVTRLGGGRGTSTLGLEAQSSLLLEQTSHEGKSKPLQGHTHPCTGSTCFYVLSLSLCAPDSLCFCLSRPFFFFLLVFIEFITILLLFYCFGFLAWTPS